MIEPRTNSLFLGHRHAVAALHDAAVSGRLHHGWLIGGPAGTGKATLAFRFARWLLAGGETADLSVPPEHPVFKRITAGSHADLLTIEPRLHEKTGRMQTIIAVDTVREIKGFMHLTAGEGGWRVVIVDGAELMNASAANAFLKALEEPPPRTILLLVSDAPGRLRPTIRSRCRMLQLQSLDDEDISTLLTAYAPGLPTAEAERLVALSGGSIGTALMLAAAGGVALAGMVDEALQAPLTAARAQAVADTVARSDDGYPIFMTLLRAGLARQTLRAARAAAGELAGGVALWQEMGRLEQEVMGLNLDKRAAVIVALNALHAA